MNCILICVLILVWRAFPLAFGEFSLLNEEHPSWTAYFSAESDDCSYDGRKSAFPHLYTPPLDGAVPSAPANFSVEYVEREALERGGLAHYYYPGMLLKLVPPDDDTYGNLLGYEVMIDTNERRLCVIFNMSEGEVSDRMEIVEQELFPMSGLKLYKFSLTSLPPSTRSGYGELRRVVTGQFGVFREGGALPAPVYWVATISYHVVRNGTGGEGGEGGSGLQVVFSRPPLRYGFGRFEIALVPEEVHIELRIHTTTEFYHTFTEVQPGHYKVSVKPIDDHFSLSGQCLCHYDNGRCSNCLTTQTEVFIVE